MDNVVDIREYVLRKKKCCRTCRSTSTDNWLNMLMCTNDFSEVGGQIVEDSFCCEYYIRRTEQWQ